MGSDQVGIIDIAIIEITLCLHLGLDSLNDFTFTQQLVIDLDTGNLLKGTGQRFGFIGVCWNCFR